MPAAILAQPGPRRLARDERDNAYLDLDPEPVVGFFVDDEAAALAHGRRVLLLGTLRRFRWALALDHFELERSPLRLQEAHKAGMEVAIIGALNQEDAKGAGWASWFQTMAQATVPRFRALYL